MRYCEGVLLQRVPKYPVIYLLPHPCLHARTPKLKASGKVESQNSEVGRWKLKVGSWKLKVGSRKSEVKIRKLKVKIWKVGSQKSEVGRPFSAFAE